MRGRGKPDLNTKIEEALSFPCRFGESALEAGFSPMDCFGVSPHYDFGRRRPHPEENKCGLAFLIDKKADCKFSEQRIEIIVGGKRLEIQRCQLNRDSDWDLIWEAFKLQQ